MIGCLVGNKSVNESLKNLIDDAHLPHAIIIEGDEGTGRHTLALYLAKASLCKGDNKPCDVCRDCMLTIGHNHPDITFFAPEEKKKSLSVDQVRKIKTDAFVKSHRGGKKVFIIDKADALSDNSQNALLKTIEEPPQDILFILICESSARLLSTVISRCTVFSLFPPEEKESLEYIRSHTKKSDEEIIKALGITHNNIGKALSILSKRKSENGHLAEKFLDGVLEYDSAVNLMLLLKPLHKDRIKTGEFISELKLITAERITQNTHNAPFLKNLLKIYETVSQMEDLLVTNINLPLFFATLISNIV